MFKNSDFALYKSDMADNEKVAQAALQARSYKTFSANDKNADYYAYNIQCQNSNISFTIRLDGLEQSFKITSSGNFNVENALAAIALAHYYHIPVNFMRRGLSKAYVPGRMELLSSYDKNLLILVDYAHNRMSFEEVLHWASDAYPNYILTLIFGASGDKALQRRAQLGELLAMVGKNTPLRIIISSQDPGYESPKNIANEIASHFQCKGQKYKFIENRSSALKYAVSKVAEGEKHLILLLGKGNERYQRIANELVPIQSDLSAAHELIAAYNLAHA